MLDKLFATFTPEDVATLMPYLTRQTAERGTVIIDTGSEDRSLIMLVKGGCEVYQKFVLANNLYALRTAGLDAPRMFGETNMLLGDKRQSTVIASSEVQLLTLSYDKFLEMKTQNPDLAMKVLEHIGVELSKRFFGMQKNMLHRLTADAPTPQIAVAMLRKYVGETHVCSAALAKKLFNLKQPPYSE